MTENLITFQDKSLEDACQQAAIQDWLPLEIMQLSPGQYQGDIKVIKQHNVRVVFESQNRTIHKRGIMSKDLCTVSFFQKTNSVSRFSSYKPEENSIFLLPGGAEFDVQVAEHSATVYFLLDQASLLKRLRNMNPSGWDKEPDNLLLLQNRDSRSLNTLVESLLVATKPLANMEGRIQCSSFETLIIDHIVLSMTTAVATDGKGRDTITDFGRVRGLMNRFIEYAQAEFEQQRCPSIVEICLALGVSQRTLQNGFHKILGVTPIAYLRCHRLNKVRQHLLDSCNKDDSVTSIATYWHFLHLSKFSYDYKKMFGELPSTTLSRARANQNY